MREIEVGEYVRTREGHLGKLMAINEKDYNYLGVDTTKEIRNDGFPATYLYLKNEDIVKHSKKIIDLIEVGDYVNGQEVIEIYEEEDMYCNSSYQFKEKNIEVQNDEYECVPIAYLYTNKEIKTILTKEQYTKNCFEVMQG